MDQIGGNHFVQDHRPVALIVRQWEVVDGGLRAGPQLLQHVLDVELERFLTEVGIDYLSGRLQTDRRV